ncbi:MAG: hypothetical protein ACLGH0_00605, partial [Thermoanaerobaculia bacterium]
YVPVREVERTLAERASADGRILIILCETAADCVRAETLARTTTKTQEDVLLALPKESLSNLSGLVAETLRWEWVIRNTPELDGDKFAREEASRQLSTARAILATRIDGLIGVRSPRGAQALRWFAGGREKSIGEGRELLRALSDFCDALYPRAPQVRNELLNRQTLSSAAAAARMRLIGAILKSSSEPLLGMDATKKPPEMSMYLSLLRGGALHRQLPTGEWAVVAPDAHDPLRLRPAFDAIHAFLSRDSDARLNVAELLARLAAPPFGIRAGLAPVLLALYVATNVQEIALYEEGTFLREIGENEFLRLTKAPRNFELQLCRIAGLRQDVFQSLLRVLQLETGGGREPLILDVVRPICMYVAQLPDYARSTRRLSSETLRVRAAILAAREPVTLLFHDLPIACGVDPFAPDTTVSPQRARNFATKLRASLDELRNAFDALLERLREAVRAEFALLGTFEQARKSVGARADALTGLATDPTVRAFCVRLADTAATDRAWLESLASLLATQPPARWTDAHEETFARELHTSATRFRNLESIAFAGGTHETFAEAFHLSLTTRDGNERQRVVLVERDRLDDVNALAREIEVLVQQRGVVGLAALSRAAWATLKEE